MQTIKADIVIIGAGIAGLWLHHRLNDLGFKALLIDKYDIGSGQTLSSQGIIHGGIKYTLNGLQSKAASAIADMPNRWLACLNGEGEINLSKTGLICQHQLMWSTKSLSSKLTTFFSSKALSSKVQTLAKENYPELFKTSEFKGLLYQLNEPVLDVHSLITNLSAKWGQRIFQINSSAEFTTDDNSKVKAVNFADINIEAQEFVLTSGEGNQELLDRLSISKPKMQRRPLQMVLAKGAQLPHICAHCIGISTKPIATITTHQHSDGDTVWYIGGNIAEQGVNQDSTKLIAETQRTLGKILPWVNLNDTEWTTHCINRAEPVQKQSLRPDTAFVETVNNVHIAWPTKLALSPTLADQVIETLNKSGKRPDNTIADNFDQQLHTLTDQYSMTISPSLWDRAFPG